MECGLGKCHNKRLRASGMGDSACPLAHAIGVETTPSDFSSTRIARFVVLDRDLPELMEMPWLHDVERKEIAGFRFDFELPDYTIRPKPTPPN